MRRLELINAAKELHSALLETRVAELVGMGERKREEGRNHVGQVLEALKVYSILAHNFSPATKQLVEIFGLRSLEDTNKWLIYTESAPAALRMRSNITFAITYLPSIILMVEPESLSLLNRETEEGSAYKNMRVLSVTVFEPKNLFSSPVRLANVLESINHFYTACALMENESPSTLSVVGCDSGSDKSFDFLGLAKVMECVERLIETIWDRAFFFRERQFEERLELVAKSLPVIEHIDTMEKQKQIDPEMAEILRRNIFDGSNKFLQSGATIPKIEDTSEYNPRSLLSPVQKLLVAAPDESANESKDVFEEEASSKVKNNDSLQDEGSDTNKFDMGNLTAEEQEQLIKLVEKSQHSKSLRESAIKSETEFSEEVISENIDDDLSI